MIVRAWAVATAYFGGKIPKYPRGGKMTRERMGTLLTDDDASLPGSKTQFDRARSGWPELMPEWPLRPGMRPPWEDGSVETPPEVIVSPPQQIASLHLGWGKALPQIVLPEDVPPHRLSYTLSDHEDLEKRYKIGSPNDYMCKILGYRSDEMIGCRAPDLFCPDQDRAVGGRGREFFRKAKEHPGEVFTYGPITLRASNGHLVDVERVDLFWSVHGQGCWVISAFISDEEDARYRMQHPGAQFPDVLDRQHFADYHALRRRDEPVLIEVPTPDGKSVIADAGEVVQAILQLPMFRSAASIVVAAGLSAVSILDGSDGKYDGVVHWCRMLHQAARVLA